MEWSRSRELLLGRGGKKRPQQKDTSQAIILHQTESNEVTPEYR